MKLVLQKNIPAELLSRAKILPADEQVKNEKIENLFEEIFSNLNDKKILDDENNANGGDQFEKNQSTMNPYSNQSFYENVYTSGDLINFSIQSDHTITKNDSGIINWQDNNQNENIKKEIKFGSREYENILFNSEDFKTSGNSLNNQAIELYQNNNYIFHKTNNLIDTKDDNTLYPNLPIIDNQANDLSGNLNNLKINENLNIAEYTQNIGLKNNPLDFFSQDIYNNKIESNALISINVNNSFFNNASTNIIPKPLDNQTLFDFFKDNHKQESPLHQEVNTNQDNYQHLNFYLGNEEQQTLLNNNNPLNNVQLGNRELKQDIDCSAKKSINNVNEINEFFSFGDVLSEANAEITKSELNLMAPSEYRKSLESNHNTPNKKKIEKLFYNDKFLQEFNFKVTQNRYDTELVEILLNVTLIIIFMLLNVHIAFNS